MEKKEKKQAIDIYKILTVVFAAVLIAVLIVLGRNWFVQHQAEKEYEKLSSQVNELQGQMNDNAILINGETGSDVADKVTESMEPQDSESTLQGATIPKKNLDWNKLHHVNGDIYAWIYIPGTEVDYPLLQHPTDDSYYLNYNLNGTRGYPGCIYTEHANSKDFTDFDTVVYGHNMRNSSMFASLHNYEDSAFFANYPYVYIYTEENKVLVYEIYAAYQSDNAHILHTNDFSTTEGKIAYLEKIVKNTNNSQKVKMPVELSVDSHLLTLSTCVKGKSNKRFLVQAVLLNEDEL